jgi:hypothetical protein
MPGRYPWGVPGEHGLGMWRFARHRGSSAGNDEDKGMMTRTIRTAHPHSSDLCEPFLRTVPVTGASVSVLSGPVGQSTVCSSNETAARLDELQFDLGEGPCWLAMSRREPVLAPVLAESTSTWPMFTEAVLSDRRGQHVAGMFAFPLVVGTLEIGAVDLYSTQNLTLSRSQIAEVSALADVAAWEGNRPDLGREYRAFVAARSAPGHGDGARATRSERRRRRPAFARARVRHGSERARSRHGRGRTTARLLDERTLNTLLCGAQAGTADGPTRGQRR